jgi:hypothetical protein
VHDKDFFQNQIDGGVELFFKIVEIYGLELKTG